MATIEMSANPIVKALKKPCEKFTKEDIKSYIKKTISSTLILCMLVVMAV